MAEDLRSMGNSGVLAGAMSLGSAPQNLAAEERVLGALLLAGALGLEASERTLGAVRQTGLGQTDFYRAGHGRIYRACQALVERKEPCEALLVVWELRGRSELEEAGGETRVHELLALAPGASNAAHWARLVVEAAARRRELRVGRRLVEASANGGLEASAELQRELGALLSCRSGDGRDGIVTISAAEIEHEPVAWLSASPPACGRIPLGALTLLVGDPGLGKSLFTCLLAAEVSGQGQAVVMLTAEDALAPVVVPRLEAVGADLRRVHFLRVRREGIEDGLVLPADGAALARLVAEHEARLVVVDPLDAHLEGQINSWRSHDVRRALAPLSRLAEEGRCAVLVVAHLNKSMSRDPLYRVGGSIGLPAAVRSQLLFSRDPDDPEGEQGSQRVLAHAKCNYGQLAGSLVLCVEPILIPAGEGTPRVETARVTLIGTSSHSGVSLLRAKGDEEEKRDRLTEAIEFLEAELAEGPRLSRDIERTARELGIARRTLERARKTLGVRASASAPGEPWMMALGEASQACSDPLAGDRQDRDRQPERLDDGGLGEDRSTAPKGGAPQALLSPQTAIHAHLADSEAPLPLPPPPTWPWEWLTGDGPLVCGSYHRPVEEAPA